MPHAHKAQPAGSLATLAFALSEDGGAQPAGDVTQRRAGAAEADKARAEAEKAVLPKSL